MGRLDQNLAALAAHDHVLASRIEACDRAASGGHVQVATATTGVPALEYDGRLEASREDPEAEAALIAGEFLRAAERAGASRLVVYGLGLHTLSRLTEFAGQVLVVEPSLEIARAAFEALDLTSVLPRLTLCVTDDIEAVAAQPLMRGESVGVLVAHPAARRRAPEFYERLSRRFDPGGDARPLNVVVVPPLYGGSLPVAHACARALRRLGHRVRPLDLEGFWSAYTALDTLLPDVRLGQSRAALRTSLQRVIGEALLASFELDPPDLVFALAQAPLDATTLQTLRRRGVSTAFWFCEDFHVMPYWRDVCAHYDVFFHLQPEHSQALREAGGFGVPLPLAFDPAVHHPVNVEPEARMPLSFVGAGYHNRRQFLPALFDLGLRVFGVEWPMHPDFLAAMPQPNHRQPPEACNRIFNATDINLNLHSCPWADGVNPAGDYVNPRTFELAGASAFQLVDQRSELGRSFETGSEIETFRDAAECRAKIRHYSERPDERAAIASRAHARAEREHTFDHRMRDAVDAIRSGPRPPISRVNGSHTVAALSRQAADTPGLRTVMERLESGRNFDLDAVGEAISEGVGDLSREEKLLLFMRETRDELATLHNRGVQS